MIMATEPTCTCMEAHADAEKQRFHRVNHAAILFNKIALSENVQMGISTDNLGMGLSAILKGVYQVRAIGSGAVTPPSVFSHTVPSTMTIGMDYQIAFSGVNSSQGTVTYTISTPTSLGSMGSFSKAAGINAGENITVSWHATTGGGVHDMAVPGNYSFDVRAYAGQTLVATNTINFTLAAASVAVNVSEVFKTTLYDGSTEPVAIVNGINMRDYGGLGIFKATDYYAEAVATTPEIAPGSGSWVNLANSSGDILSNNGAAIERRQDGFVVYPNVSTSFNGSGHRYVNWAFRQHEEFLQTLFINGHVAGTETILNLNVVNPGAVFIIGNGGGPKYFACKGMPGNQVLALDESDAPVSVAPTTLWEFNGKRLILSPAFPTGDYKIVVFNDGVGSNAIIKCGVFTASEWTPASVNLGFEIGWLLYRELNPTSARPSTGWKIIDDVRGMEGTNKELTFESLAERTVSGFIDPTPSGFTVMPASNYNRPDSGYVYIAIKKDPNAVSAGQLNGTITPAFITSANAGASGSLSFSGMTASVGTPTYSIVENGTSYFTFSKTTGIASGENVTWSLSGSAPTSAVNFTISANTNPSASNGPMTVTHTFQVTGAAVTPTMSGVISHNIPSSVTAGSNYSVTFGGKSATSGTVLYGVNVNSGSQYVTFTKTSGIAAGETVYLSVASNAPNGGGVSGTITANTSPVGASNGPDAIGFSLGTLALVEPDPSFSGFSHTVPANTQQGQSYTVTFSGTSSSNGHQVWYSLSPQTGLSFSKLDNISPGEAVTMTVSGSASGTLGVSVYANTTKNSGSTFTQSVSFVQTTVAVPVTVNLDHLSLHLELVNFGPGGTGDYYGATYKLSVSGAVASDGRTLFWDLTNADWSRVYAANKAQGELFTFVSSNFANFVNDETLVVKDTSGTVLGWTYLAQELGVTIFGQWPNGLPINISH